MQHASHVARPGAAANAIPGNSLRSEMDRRRGIGVVFTLKEAIAVIVPLCTDIAQQHARGARIFVHPSTIVIAAGGLARIAAELSGTAPSTPRDRACLAPEEKHGQPGDARASVFSIGAILYELLTGETVGPGMRRPTQVLPGLNPGVEVVLGKALVTDRGHRPDDLGATHLDHGADFDVDVSLSMLPPAAGFPVRPAVQVPPASRPGAPAPLAASNSAPDPYAMEVVDAPRPLGRPDDPTARLADMKTRLESDPRPRYVVVKDGMDHGPFNAVELLQQIGSHAFEKEHVLRDTYSGDERPIAEWDEFAPFAEHSKLNREIVAEKKAIEQVVVAEAKDTRAKTFFGLGAIALILGGAAVWYLKVRAARNDAIEVEGENGINVESAGGLKGANKKAGSRVGTAPGGFPILAGGMSCEQARARYVEEISIGGPKGQADLTANQFGSVLNNGGYVVGCGAPQSMHVNVCAAVQNGRAVGVTISTEPPNGGIAGCVANAVRRMSFPSNPKLDIATTRF